MQGVLQATGRKGSEFSHVSMSARLLQRLGPKSDEMFQVFMCAEHSACDSLAFAHVYYLPMLAEARSPLRLSRILYGGLKVQTQTQSARKAQLVGQVDRFVFAIVTWLRTSTISRDV